MSYAVAVLFITRSFKSIRETFFSRDAVYYNHFEWPGPPNTTVSGEVFKTN